MKAAAVLIGLLLIGCGGGEFCGDGEVNGDEECDDGNMDETDFCRACEVYLPPRTTIEWRFNADAAEGFTQDGCLDLGVSSVRVEMQGPMDADMEDSCSNRQVVFTDLVPGDYTAVVTPLDSGGDSLVNEPIEMPVTARSSDVNEQVVIPPDAWVGPYTGTFFFTVRWAGVDCANALPSAVDMQTVTLTVGGQVVTQMTTEGEPLDGSAPFTCVPASNPSPISALQVPFGPATILIVGYNAGVEQFRGTFDTFVGAGPSNPTIDYDVPTVFDAGI